MEKVTKEQVEFWLGSDWSKNEILEDLRDVTKEQVEFWLGSDWSKDEILEDLRDLANGKYKPEVLRDDIISTYHANMED